MLVRWFVDLACRRGKGPSIATHQAIASGEPQDADQEMAGLDPVSQEIASLEEKYGLVNESRK